VGVALLCVLGLRLPLLQAKQLSHAFFIAYNLTAGRVKQTNFKMKNLKCTVLALTMGASVFIGGKAFAQVPSFVPTNGLVGWWPFNGNANDESGNGNNGTVNGATLTTDRFGNANSAYFFNGNSSNSPYIIANSPINNNTASSFSFSIWLNKSNPIFQ
jgi:hypothetical protein